jgi:DAK2 domain fusion protein YloV
VVEGVQAQMENDEFGYCTEFIIRLNEDTGFSEDRLRNQLALMGDSIVVVQDEEIVKVHVHTLTPGEALNLGQRYGEFVKLKIENMQEQHDHLQTIRVDEAKPTKKKYAIVAVAAGEGVAETFKSYRVDHVIVGGQTMNPSTEDFVAAIRSLNAEHILVLPNNSNIILAAQQAQSIVDDVDVHVLATKSIPQGLSACIMFNPEVDVHENLKEMSEAFSKVKSASVTYAIKDTNFDGIEIKDGDYMGILEKQIVVSVANKLEATKTLLQKAIDDQDGLVTLIVGEDVSTDEKDEIVSYIEKEYPLCELEIIEGLQPVYSFIVGIE